MRKYNVILLIALFSLSILAVSTKITPTVAGMTITIRPDGSVDPITAPISTADRVTYTFASDIFGSITIQGSNVVIDGNGFLLQGSGFGIGFSWAGITNVTIKHTRIQNFGFAIRLVNSRSSSIVENIISANYHGIYAVSQSIMINISGNDISANNGYGIWLQSSDFATISQNKLTSNRCGVYLLYSGSNKITRNNIGLNTISGLSIFKSSKNLIYSNNFARNIKQIDDQAGFGYVNLWDNGYPSGGNYWSDYTGQDTKRGPSQDQSGSDGIGDTTYNIIWPDRDRYPLMAQIAFSTSNP